MLFSSPLFLFGFLPLVLLLYYVAPPILRNVLLLLASLLFYAWGEVFYVAIMLASIGANYCFGRLLAAEDRARRRLFLACAVGINLLLLLSFKYANFIADNVNTVLHLASIPAIPLEPVHLPLGISFFTFQALSYIIDVYRREVPAQRNLFNLALYISLFPQLIAGPIVRYHDIASQITARRHTPEMFGEGVRRFIHGLAKKMLIANPLGEVADTIFALPAGELTMPLAWIGILAYTLQIYFDFSGYSDMAIGLGRMFGFTFLENFNYPYIARSVREFWRRWHISLSTWFRDYVYIALGGNRVPPWRVYLNLLTVFVLTGFWHGASWNFLLWGLFHGVFLAAEHAGCNRLLRRLWPVLQHAYLLAVVILGWVFFRAETLPQALQYLAALFDPGRIGLSLFEFRRVVSNEALVVFCVGLLLAMPLYPRLLQGLRQHAAARSQEWIFYTLRFVILVALLGLCVLKIASSTYNPFIYFRF